MDSSSSSNANSRRNRTIVTRATITTAENGGVTIAIEGSENATSGGERSNPVSIVLDGTSSAMLNSILWATATAAPVETVNSDSDLLHEEPESININNPEASQNTPAAEPPMPASSGIIIAIKLPSDKSPESILEDDEDEDKLPPLITVAAPREQPQSSQTNKNASSGENSCEQRKRKLREPFQLDIEASGRDKRKEKKQERGNDVDTGDQEGAAEMPNSVSTHASTSTGAAAAGSNKGKQRFYCTEDKCRKNFAQKCRLKSHIETVHLGIKKFKCDEMDCGESFGRKDHLHKHKKSVHSADRPFPCKNCGRRFARKYDMKDHEKKCGTVEGFRSRAPRRPKLKKEKKSNSN